jgi:hypothetical protein
MRQAVCLRLLVRGTAAVLASCIWVARVRGVGEEVGDSAGVQLGGSGWGARSRIAQAPFAA